MSTVAVLTCMGAAVMDHQSDAGPMALIVQWLDTSNKMNELAHTAARRSLA